MIIPKVRCYIPSQPMPPWPPQLPPCAVFGSRHELLSPKCSWFKTQRFQATFLVANRLVKIRKIQQKLRYHSGKVNFEGKNQWALMGFVYKNDLYIPLLGSAMVSSSRLRISSTQSFMQTFIPDCWSLQYPDFLIPFQNIKGKKRLVSNFVDLFRFDPVASERG